MPCSHVAKTNSNATSFTKPHAAGGLSILWAPMLFALDILQGLAQATLQYGYMFLFSLLGYKSFEGIPDNI